MQDQYTVTPVTEHDEEQVTEESISGYSVEPYIEEGSTTDPIDTRPSRDPLITRHLRESQDLDKAMELTGNDLAYSLQVAKGVDPKTARRITEAQKASKLPQGTIARNLDKVESNNKDKQIMATLMQTRKDGSLLHPKTAAFLSDSQRMSLAKDEVGRLAEIEKIIANEDRRENNFIEDIGSQLKKGSLAALSNVASIPGHLNDLPAYLLREFIASGDSVTFGIGETNKDLDAGVSAFAEAYQIEASKDLINNPVAVHLREAAAAIEVEATQGSAIDQLADGEILKGSYNVFLQATESAPLMLGMMAATMAGVPAPITLGSMGEIEAAGSYAEGLERGKAPNQAMTASLVKGSAEAAFEIVTLGMMSKMLRKQGIELTKRFGKETAKQIIARSSKAMGGGFLEEGAAEAATTGVQTLADYMTGETDALDNVGKNMLNSFLVGGFTGFGMTAVGQVRETAARAKYHAEKTAMDREIARKLQEESEAPEMVELALNNNFEGEEISISPERLEEESFNQSTHKDLEGVVDEKAADEQLRATLKDLGVLDQIEEAKATGKDLRVNRAKWLVKYANTDMGKALVDDIKYGEDGLSAKDVIEAKKDVTTKLKEMTKETAAIEAAKKIHPKMQAIRTVLVKKSDMPAEEIDHQVQLFLSGGYALAKKQGETLNQWIDRVNPVLEVNGFSSKDFEIVAETPEATLPGEAAPVAPVAPETTFEDELQEKAEPLTIEQLPKEGKAEAETYVAEELGRMMQELNNSTKEYALVDTVEGKKSKSQSNNYPVWYRNVRVRNREHMAKVIASKKGPVYARLKAQAIEHLLDGAHSTQEQILPEEDFRLLLGYGPVDKVGISETDAKEDEETYFQKKVDVTETGDFKEFFEGSKVVDADGKPLIVFHGTTQAFTTFDASKGNVENDLGAGFYFSNNETDVDENYNHEDGPDLKGKLERRAEKIADEKDIEHDEAFELAREEMVGEEAITLPVYLNISNPIIIGGPNETTLEGPEVEYDEDGDVESETPGELYDFLDDHFRRAAQEYDVSRDDIDAVIGEVLEVGYESANISDVIKAIKESESLMDAFTEAGDLASSEIVRKAFEYAGFDGVIDSSVNDKFGSNREQGQSMEGVDEDTVHYIAFQPTQIKSVENEGNFDYTDPNIYHQEEGDTPNASVIFKQNETLIQLFNTANRSSLLHETGHIFFKEMQRIVDSGKGDAQVVKDLNTLKALADGKFDVDGIEKVVRGFEQYLKEGKAPSVELQDAFGRFKEWLKAIYETLKGNNLLPEINDEVRGVFDRMLATEAQIAEANEYFNQKKSILDLIDTPKKDTDKSRKKSTKTAEEKLLAKYIKAFIKAEGGREGLEKVALEEIENTPIYQALEIAEDIKISKADILELGGKQSYDAIKKNHPNATAVKGGTSIAELAIDFGYDSPEALMTDLTVAKPKDAAVKDLTDSYIKKKEENILKDLSDRQTLEGTEEIHNDSQLATLLAEYQILSEKIGQDSKATAPHVIQARIYRDVARETLAAKPFAKAARYDLHAKTEKRYMKLAYKHAAAGNLEAAAKAMNKQILNHIMVQESIKIRDAKLKAEKYYKTKNMQNKLKNIEHAYMLTAIDLVGKYSLNPSLQTAEEIPNLKEVDEGLNDQLPEWVFTGHSPSGKNNWKEITYTEFQALDETIKSIIHAGKGALLSMEGSDLATVQDAVEASIKDMAQLDDATIRKQSKKITRMLRDTKLGRMWSEGVMLEYVYEELDNYSRHRSGEFGTMMSFQNRGREVEGDTKDIIKNVMHKASPHLKTINKAKMRLEKELGSGFFNIKGFPVPEILQAEGVDKWTVEKMIAFLLNTGNKHNYEVLQNAYNLTPNQVQKMSVYFTKAELSSIQGIWDVTNTLYDPLNATNFRMYNRNLPKVEAHPITLKTKGGETITLPGGYYPLSFDRSISDIAEKHQEDDLMKDRNKSVLRSQKPKDGVTKDRTGKAHSLPPLLELRVWSSHIKDTARFITHAEYLRDMARITAHKDWKDTARKKIGKDLYVRIRDNLKYQARPQRVFESGFDGFFNWSRAMSTGIMLGANFGVGVKQRLSGFSAQVELGGTWILQAAKGADLKGSILGMESSELWQEVSSKSKYLRAREGSMDREISDLTSNLDPFIKKFKLDYFEESSNEMLREGISMQDARDAMFFMIQANDRAMTGIVWKAAYMKSLSENSGTLTHEQAEKKAITFADAIVAQTQPSSLPLDVNALQRSEGAARLFTAFMTWTFKQQNRFRHKHRAYKAGAITRKEYISHLVYEGVFAGYGAPLISALLRGDELDWWDLTASAASYSFAGIPIARDIPRSIKYGDPLGSISGFEVPTRLIKAGASGVDLATGDKDFMDFLWDLGRAGEAMVGIPAVTGTNNLRKNIQRMSGNAPKKKKKKR